MVFIGEKKNLTKSIIIVQLFLFFSTITTLTSNPINNNFLYHSKRNKDLFEIDIIEFRGNKHFNKYELESIIASRTTRRNTIHKVLEFYFLEFEKIKNLNSYLPPGAMSTIIQTLNRWSPEIQYFEEAKVEADINNLKEFYNQNGFHEVKVDFTFEPDTIKRKNKLIFFIQENSRYSISYINYIGLDSIPNEVKNNFIGKLKLKKKSFFFEDDVVSEVNIIYSALQNNGYFYSTYQQPVVTKDSVSKTDSLTIIFNTGTRQKISTLVFTDSTYGQKEVTNTMKYHQLFVSTGDWYSRQNVESSRQNLQALGTFDLVNIDTSSSAGVFTDTTLPFMVMTKYRKQQEWGIGLYFNEEKVWGEHNLGVDASYLNRNIGGIAQSLNLFTRLELKDISRYLDAEPEWQLGVTYAQPFLWKIDNSRVGLSSQLIHKESRQLMNNDTTYLKLSTTSFSIKFPTKLPSWTYFNGLSIDFLVEWQNPINYSDAYKEALEGAKDDSARYLIEEIYGIYKPLYDFNENSIAIEPTALIFGFSITGDTRNELFNPVSGYFTNISTDVWAGLGIAKYWRTQIAYNHFKSLNQYTVFALKARAGYILWWDRDNSYIPPDRQFFAGGANSNRGWESRQLRYFTDRVLFVNSSYNLDYARDYIGSRGIMEGSFELRWRFGKPRWTSDAVAEIINYGVITGFIDWGNTYHWIALNDEEYYKDMNIQDYLMGISLSCGLGLGFQTPVGPLRVDFALPVYDPTPGNKLNQFVFSRYYALQYWQYHLGLGYSF